MRDQGRFEELLEGLLRGEDPPASAWVPYRDVMSVLITDLSGFTRLTRDLGLERMIALLWAMRRIAVPILQANGGILVKYQADDLFAAFPRPAQALACAIELQAALDSPPHPLPAPVKFCMGIGFGDILWWGENDLYGEEVNMASKLGEDTAGPLEILLTQDAVLGVLEDQPSALFSEPRAVTVGGREYTYFLYEGGLTPRPHEMSALP